MWQSIAYDCNNTVPLFYEDYPGSIVDVTQLQIMLEKAHGYTYLKSMVKNTGRKRNYFTVPAAIRELEKIEIIQQTDRNYRLGRAVTATQKDILKAFNMTAANIKEEAIAINDELVQIATRRLQHGSQKDHD